MPCSSGLEAGEAEAACVGDVDRADGRGLGGHGRPDAESFEDAAAGVAEGGGAVVEAGLGGAGGLGRTVSMTDARRRRVPMATAAATC